MRKRALLVGINAYKNSNFDLRGCLNDVDSLHNLLLTTYDFEDNSIVLLKDASATKTRILEEIRHLFNEVRAGDVLVFSFSGHGTETTKPGEQSVVAAIVPHETVTTASLISNSEINLIVRKAIADNKLEGKVNFTAIYDCCHSGQMYRKLTWGEDGLLTYDDAILNRVLDMSLLLPNNGVRDIELNDYHVFSACRHNQTAADMKPKPAFSIEKPCGAFSFTLHKLLKSNPKATAADLENLIPDTIADIVAPHIQVPVFAVPEDQRYLPIFTV